jgi:hypothetical protein
MVRLLELIHPGHYNLNVFHTSIIHFDIQPGNFMQQLLVDHSLILPWILIYG